MPYVFWNKVGKVHTVFPVGMNFPNFTKSCVGALKVESFCLVVLLACAC